VRPAATTDAGKSGLISRPNYLRGSKDLAVSEVSNRKQALRNSVPKRIEALDQKCPNAKSMAAAFDAVRDGELRRYNWGFAIKRSSIAADPAQTTWGKWNRFALPGDYIRLSVMTKPHKRLTGASRGCSLLLRTMHRGHSLRRPHRRPAYWDVLFNDPLLCKLALETCEEITSSTSKKQSIGADYDFAISEANARCDRATCPGLS